ncbi:WAT1-related protein At1g25270-like [Mangifera indica]|uniref:WAT1-related protein At1g25270-like n=1 Tax=Mangifera indica TaxID=29780 RepID=UPI001CFBEDDC|nr:WAT1-related protein At1g25270-like [Mangifera indica]
MGQIYDFIHGLKPAMMMVVVQVAFAGVNVLYKLAANQGMSLSVIVAYRFIFAAAFMIPLAFFVEMKSRPKLNWKILFQAFLCGLFGGSLAQNLYLESMALTSVTFISAMFNLIPAITFMLAVAFRLERLRIQTKAGKAKVLGTLLGISGAMLLTFYKGKEINIFSTNVNILHYDGNSHLTSLHAEPHKRLIGFLLAIASCLSYASWLIIQTKMSEEYPCQYSSTALMCVMGAIQAIVFALCREKDWSQWKLGWDIKLLTVTYSGMVASGLMVTLLSWCVRMRGPLYATIFSPLLLVFVAFIGSLILDEKLHLGSILGATLIVCGLYSVLWGKGKEMKKATQLVPFKDFGESESVEVEVVINSNNDQTCNTNHNIISNMGDADISSKENEGKEENVIVKIK